MSPAFHSSVKTRIPRDVVRRAMDFNSSPRRRQAAEKIVTESAREVIRYAEDFARADLKDRPDDRRRWPGHPKYVDSFRTTAATVDSSGRVRAGFANDHPIANILENGADPHDIPDEPGLLAFPWDGPSSHSQPGGPQGD